MLQALIEAIIENGLQVVGWAVLKLVTLGRYKGFQPEDMFREGAVGLGLLFVAGYAAYRWLW